MCRNRPSHRTIAIHISLITIAAMTMTAALRVDFFTTTGTELAAHPGAAAIGGATPTPTPVVTPSPGPVCQSGQNFDVVVAPALPIGWWSMATGALGPWVTGTPANTAANAAVNGSVATVSDSLLMSPTIPIAAAGGSFSFWLNFNTEAAATGTEGFDGAVLEISINGGAFADILAAGGSFSTGGYTRTISTAFASPIAGRQAWSGKSNGYIISKVTLPTTANGQNIALRWRNTTDATVNVAGGGVRVDTITGIPCAAVGGPTPTPGPGVTPTPTPTPPPHPTATPTPTQSPTPSPTPNFCQSSQNFDGVTAPALPPRWTSTATGALGPWEAGTPADTAPNAAVNGSVATWSDSLLVSPSMHIAAGGGTFSFRINFNTEAPATGTTGFDGAVLEISINGGAFQDIVAAGGTFVTGGYTRTISTAFASPIAGRMAWSGNSAGYIPSIATLPPTANFQHIVLRWRNTTDTSVAVTGGGVRVDTIVGMPCHSPLPSPTPPQSPTPSVTPTPSPAPLLIRFTQPTYTEDESQSAAIVITRSGSLSGTNTVNFQTSNGTAVGGPGPGPGIDYQTVNQNVTFNPGETFKTVNVPIFGDALNEPTETVNLTLTGFGTLAEPEVKNAVLNINDTASLHRRADPMCTNLGAPADLYPSTIIVNTGPVQIGNMRVTLYDLEHVFPDHIDVVLVGPGGQKFVLMGDAGGSIAIPNSNAVTLSFRDAGPGVLPNSGPLVTGNFEPTTWETPVTSFPAPAPPAPYNEPGSAVGGSGPQTLFGTFGLTNSNGTWNLYVRDDAGAARSPEAISGCFNGGWGIEFLTSTAANASISGRVLTAGGQGIRNAEVVISAAL